LTASPRQAEAEAEAAPCEVKEARAERLRKLKLKGADLGMTIDLEAIIQVSRLID
jgi:hypothetical protein